MAEIKLILLDFDGTLVDTREANALAYIATLREAGIEITKEEYLSKYFGVRCMEFLRMVGITNPDTIQYLRRRKVELYPEFFDTIKLNEPLWQWSQMMRRLGAQVWIVSTGHIDNITNVLRYLHLEGCVDGILSGDDVSRPKPYADCFIKAMEIAGVSPHDSIIFEDSEVGLEAARRSGAPYVAINMDDVLLKK